jgi:hypothetical protein
MTSYSGSLRGGIAEDGITTRQYQVAAANPSSLTRRASSTKAPSQQSQQNPSISSKRLAGAAGRSFRCRPILRRVAAPRSCLRSGRSRIVRCRPAPFRSLPASALLIHSTIKIGQLPPLNPSSPPPTCTYRARLPSWQSSGRAPIRRGSGCRGGSVQCAANCDHAGVHFASRSDDHAAAGPVP